MKVTKDKVAEWSLESIVGSIVLAILTGIVTVYTGSWDVVAPFVAERPFESIMCASFVLVLGIIIGLLIRHRIAIKQLAAKDAEIAELEKQVAELEKRPIQGQRTVMTETDKRNRTREFLRSKIAEMTASQVRLVMDASMGAKLQIEAQDAIELAGIGVAMPPSEAIMHCYSDGDLFDLRLTPEMNKAVSTETQFFLDEAKSKIEGFERLKEKKL